MKPRTALPVLLVLIALPLRADIVHLKGGGEIAGEIVGEDGSEVRVRTSGGGVVSIARERIDRIERKEDPRREYARRSSELAADDAEGRVELARWCLAQGLREEAITELRRALDARPGHEEAAKILAELVDPQARWALDHADRLVKDGRADEALEEYGKVLDEFPETQTATIARLRIAALAIAGGAVEEARRWIDPVLAADPANRVALDLLERCALAAGDYAGAHETATRLDDGNALWVRKLLDYQSGLAGGIAAHAVLDAVEVLVRLGRPAGVRRECRRLIETGGALDPGDRARVHRSLADAEEALGRPDGAVAALRQAMAAELPEAARAEFADRAGTLEAVLRYGSAAAGVPHLEIRLLETEVEAYLASGEEDRRRAALERIEPVAQGRRALFEAIVRHGPGPASDVPRGVSTARAGDAEYVRFVPESYSPDRPAPLVIALHGQGGNGAWAVDLLDDEAGRRGWRVAAPSADPERGLGWSTYGVELVLAVLRDMKRTFRVDPERIYLDGVSMGGHAALALAGLAADEFAAVACRAGSGESFFRLQGDSAADLRHVGVYMVHGASDVLVKPASAQGTARLLEAAGVDHVLRVLPAKGHLDFAEENAAVFDWLAAHRRPRYPERLDKTLAADRYGRAYWLSVDSIFTRGETVRLKLEGPSGEVFETIEVQRSPAVVHAELGRGNQIEVHADRVSTLRVALSGEMFDLDREVRIRVDGKTRFEGKVERSVAYLLERCRVDAERDRLYWNEVTIRLPR